MRSKYILSSVLIMRMVVFGAFAADDTVLADEAVNITCPSDYPNIDSNATSENDCWRECTTDDVANSMSVVGKNYYGSGTDTCEPTQCAVGWQIVPDIVKTIGIDSGTNYAYVTNDNVFTESNWDNLGAKGQDYYGITDKNSFAGDFENRGMVIGRALCSSQYGDSNGKVWIDPTTFDELNDETVKSGAGYCYCKIDSYISKDGVNQSVIGPWVIYDYIGECSESCASYCAGTIVRPRDNINSGRLRIALIQDVGTFDACIKRYYRVRSGEYLPAGGETALICPVDHYCPYATNFPYDTDHDKNLYKCPSDYPNSDAGATSENQCYKQCTTDDVANSMSVSGRNYIGDGYDTCAATECVAGWVLKDFVNIITSDSASAVNSASITNDGVFQNGGGLGREYYGISEPNTFAIDYGEDGMITGHGRCSTKVGNGISYSWDVPTQYDELDDETGQSGANYCYCRVDSYTPVGGLTQILSDEPWTFLGQFNSCAQECSLRCKDYIKGKTGGYYKHILGNATCVVPEYVVKSGKYLPAGGEEPVDCPSGYYCPGAGDVKLNDEKDQGLVACPVDYPNSDTGATSENQCYKQCTTDDVAGAMTVVGTDYYGDGLNTCDATECVAGWRLKAKMTLADVIGSAIGINSAHIDNNGIFEDGDTNLGYEYYGISEKNSFAMDYVESGMIIGHGRCSTQSGTNNNGTFANPTIVNTLADETGMNGAVYCYVQIDSYIPYAGNKISLISNPWMFVGQHETFDKCASYCARYSKDHLKDASSSNLRKVLFNSIELPGNICEEIMYTLNPGEYLPVGGEEPVDCPNGSYCPGGETVYWNKDEDQGIKVCPSDYPNSDTGAKTESDCYKPCTTDDVAGAMTVIGTDYYGDGLNTCEPTACVAGWRLKAGKILSDVIGTEPGINSASVNSMGSFIEDDGNGSAGQAYYDISKPGEFAVGYGDRGIITGWALCSTKGGTGVFNGGTSADKITRFDELVDESDNVNADYCYCMIDDYTPYGGVKQSVSTPWFLSAYESSCQAYCEKSCSMALRRTAVLMEAVLGAAELSADICEENGTYLPDGATEYVRCPDGYDNSDIGATSENQCYKQCTTDDVAGAMTVVGRNYYGDGTDTCDATECVAGWNVKPGETLADIIGGYSNVNSAIIGWDSQYTGRFIEWNRDNLGAKGEEYYGITENNTFAWDYGDLGMVYGRALCSSKYATTFDELIDETGGSNAIHCYCRFDGYKPVGENKQNVTASWVYIGNYGSSCSGNCIFNCGNNGAYSAMLNTEQITFGTCTEIIYTLNPGQYLPAGGEEPADCPSGYYCPGAGDVKYDEEKDQGLVACPDGYDNSDIGATSENQCYKQCTTDDVAGSMTVVGRNYYGDGVDTCAATQCLADWKLQDLYGIVGDTEGLNSAYISTNSSSYGEFVEYNEPRGQDYYAISEPGTFGIDYGDMGVITGRARCSTKPGVGGANPTRFKELDDESSVDGARYCYCRVESYTPVGGLTQVLSDMPWVFKEESWSESGCNEYCAQSCAGGLKPAYEEVLAFRSAVFGYASCDEEVYRVNPGDYLPEGADAPSDCPPGSYCPGAEDISSRPSKAQGANECPSEYPYSDSGAKSENSCYRDCTSDDVVNSMTVAGRNYYGDGVDTCEPTDCVAGWHLKLGLNLEDLIGSTYEGSNSEYMAGENSAYIDNNGSFVEYNTADNGAAKGQEYYGITSNNSFAVGYGDSGMIRGHSICSTQSDDIVDDLTDESDNTDAINCYCRIEEYISADGVKQNVAAPWVKWGDINWYPGACESNCVQNCAAYMREHMYLEFRGKMFEASMEIPMCLANKININWNLGYGDNNSSTTTCSYNEVIVLPQEPVRPGYIFTGWKVLKSNQ